MKKQVLFTLILLMSLSLTMSAQTDVSPWGIGLSVGKMEHTGDRGSNIVFGSPMEANFGLRVGRYLSSSFDIFLAGSLGKIGTEGDTPDETFEAKVTQVNLAAHYKLLKDKKFTPFISLGIGYASFSAESANSADDSGLELPIAGLGFRYNFTDAIGLFYHGQYALYSGDEYDGLTDDSNDNHLLHEFGLGINLGKQDMDGDGVADKKDACPETPGLKQFAGCPDTDLDGIIDGDDACPDVAGLAEYNGCPDTDGDGIIDGNDACPQVAGDAMYAGCPDTDGDGIGDNLDECPNESGVSKYNGCPIPDSDGDGFDDDNDNCPRDPGQLYGCPDKDEDKVADKDDQCSDVPGSVDAYGCPDADGDGVADKDDKCPNEAGIPELDGCPKVRIPTDDEVINGYSSPMIIFERGTTPADDYDAHIASIVEFANAYPQAYLNISGYSDSQGSESSNMTVSNRRARKVYESLVKAGIDPDRLTYEGYGESNPIADNTTADGRRLNRRVIVTASTVKRVKDTGGKR